LIKILHQDEHIIVVHKPSGLLVHKSAIDKYETHFLIQTLRDQIAKSVFLVHRLDKPTSGVMVLALNKQSARLLCDSFAKREVDKVYVALVRGYVSDQVLDYPLQEVMDKKTDSRADQNKQAQAAVSELSLIATSELPIPVARYNSARFSLVKLCPKTGRKHQLRRHLAHIRHPILGDTTHGDGKQNQFAREHMNLHRLALVATRLRFKHPIYEEYLDISTQIDQDLQTAWQIFT